MFSHRRSLASSRCAFVYFFTRCFLHCTLLTERLEEARPDHQPGSLYDHVIYWLCKKKVFLSSNLFFFLWEGASISLPCIVSITFTNHSKGDIEEIALFDKSAA